jgi:SAM-dependent methyltransferase
MTTLRIDNQYATGRSRQRIERALIDGGKDLGHLAPGDLGAVEDFHTSGRIATSRLAGLAEITSDDEVLDAGSGVGGTARYLADQFGCRVAAVDLTGGVRRNGPLALPVGRVGGHISPHGRRDPTCRFGQPVSPS